MPVLSNAALSPARFVSLGVLLPILLLVLLGGCVSTPVLPVPARYAAPPATDGVFVMADGARLPYR